MAFFIVYFCNVFYVTYCFMFKSIPSKTEAIKLFLIVLTPGRGDAAYSLSHAATVQQVQQPGQQVNGCMSSYNYLCPLLCFCSNMLVTHVSIWIMILIIIFPVRNQLSASCHYFALKSYTNSGSWCCCKLFPYTKALSEWDE